MALVSVPALKPLSYQGRSYVRGEMVPMEAADAAAAARAGNVALDGREIKPYAENNAPPRTRRRQSAQPRQPRTPRRRQAPQVEPQAT